MEKMVTENEVLNLKKEALGIRDNIISAKSTMKSVEKNIEDHEAALKELGVKDVNNVEATLKEISEEIYSSTGAAKELLESYKEVIK